MIILKPYACDDTMCTTIINYILLKITIVGIIIEQREVIVAKMKTETV